MFRNGFKVNRTTVYSLSSMTARDLVKNATIHFELFKKYKSEQSDTLAHFAISQSRTLYLQAIEQSTSLTDIAYCHRKYASTVIRDHFIAKEITFADAQQHLMKSIEGFELALSKTTNSEEEEILELELQRALVSLGQVSLTLKDGVTLEKCTHQLNASLNIYPNPLFELEMLTYTYHVRLSENNVEAAQQSVSKAFELSLKNGLPNATNYRHQAKLNLLKISTFSTPQEKEKFFVEEIQKKFWSAFDAHKNLKGDMEYRVRNDTLLKDFCMLLNIKIVQRLNNITDNKPNESIYDYMQRQVSAVYHPNKAQHNYVLKIIRKAIDDIKNQQKIILAYKLFDNSPPEIAITAEQFGLLFPDVNKFIDLPELINSTEKLISDLERSTEIPEERRGRPSSVTTESEKKELVVDTKSEVKKLEVVDSSKKSKQIEQFFFGPPKRGFFPSTKSGQSSGNNMNSMDNASFKQS